MGEKGTLGYEAMKKGLLPLRSKREPNFFDPNNPTRIEQPWEVDKTDPDQAFNPGTGENAVWDGEKQQWIDAKSGQPIGGSGLTPLK